MSNLYSANVLYDELVLNQSNIQQKLKTTTDQKTLAELTKELNLIQMVLKSILKYISYYKTK
jgi:hypothetical protein